MSSLILSRVVRCLGYMSATDAEFESWLTGSLDKTFADSQCVVHACGHCLRDPKHIATFINWVFAVGAVTPRTTPNNLKAVSQILRYRAEATMCLSSECCQQILAQCLKIFHREMESGGTTFSFRWSSLTIAFLLRRRMYDVEFLSPDDPLAVHAKSLFAEAITRYDAGGLCPIGGSVDTPAALRQLIDYIDRRGRGDVLIAAEAD